MASKAKLDGLFGARFHVTVYAKYNEVAKLPWQRSWCFQQMWPDVFPMGLVSMKGDSRVHPDLFYDPDAVQRITHRRSKTQLVLVKNQLCVIRPSSNECRSFQKSKHWFGAVLGSPVLLSLHQINIFEFFKG